MATTQRSIPGTDIVAAARRFLGIPYVFGGVNPATGLDCSGLVVVTCQTVGIQAPRTSEEQFAWGIPTGSPSPGDLVFFVGDPIDPPPGHVGIVVQPGVMINAPFSGTVVRYDNYGTNGTGFMGYRQIPGVGGSGPSPTIPPSSPFMNPNSNVTATSPGISTFGQNPFRPAGIVGSAIGGIAAALFTTGMVIAAIIILMVAGLVFIRSI